MRRSAFGVLLTIMKSLLIALLSFPSFASHGSLICTVRDDVTGVGVENAAIDITSGKMSRTTVTDNKGFFKADNLPIKGVTVSISKLHYSRFPTVLQLTLSQGTTACEATLIRDDGDEAYYRLASDRIIYDLTGTEPTLTHWEEIEVSSTLPGPAPWGETNS